MHLHIAVLSIIAGCVVDEAAPAAPIRVLGVNAVNGLTAHAIAAFRRQFEHICAAIVGTAERARPFRQRLKPCVPLSCRCPVAQRRLGAIVGCADQTAYPVSLRAVP